MAMAMKSIIARLRNQVRNFAAARDGNIAIIFALASLPIVGMMGAAIDYSRANAVKADLQSALDATALMVSKSAPTMTATELQTAANSYFNALFTSAEAGATTITATYLPDTSTVTLTGNTSVKSDFVGILGSAFANLPVGGNANVSWGSSRLRVALALDNTGSMASSNKMTALKSAAKNLLTQLQSAALKSGDVYVSIVPFAKDVNVGATNYDATWLDWQDHKDSPKDYVGWDSLFGTCSKNLDNGEANTKANCLTHNNAVWTPNNHNTWNGCVTDRDQRESVNGANVTRNYDIVASTPDPTKAATKFPAEQFASCPVALMPLSYDWTALKNKIDSMQPNGNTNVTIGLVWGWQTLLSTGPFAAPAEDPKYKYKKVLILLTDGDNTQNRFSSDQATIDARTKKACENAKAADITIYTVLVMQGSQSLLQACATDSKKYFYLQSADGLVSAFNQIGTDLSNLRVSK
jgi:Flp pilus assembly protein TadG